MAATRRSRRVVPPAGKGGNPLPREGAVTIRFKILENCFLLAITAVSVLFLYLATGYGRIARQLPILVCCLTLALLAVRLAQVNFAKQDTGEITFRNRVFFLGLLTVLLLVLIPVTGLLLGSVLFLPACMISFGYKKPLPIAAISLGYVACIYLLFVQMFNMPLPESLLGF